MGPVAANRCRRHSFFFATIDLVRTTGCTHLFNLSKSKSDRTEKVRLNGVSIFLSVRLYMSFCLLFLYCLFHSRCCWLTASLSQNSFCNAAAAVDDDDGSRRCCLLSGGWCGWVCFTDTCGRLLSRSLVHGPFTAMDDDASAVRCCVYLLYILLSMRQQMPPYSLE